MHRRHPLESGAASLAVENVRQNGRMDTRGRANLSSGLDMGGVRRRDDAISG